MISTLAIEDAQRFVLGTAQFGLNYGINNKSGKISALEVEKILSYAASNGVKFLDTAISYGDSERVLGEIGVSSWSIVTKLPAIPVGLNDIRGWVIGQVGESLKRLKVKQIHTLLLHAADDLMSKDADLLVIALEELRNLNLVSNIGISIYDPLKLDHMLKVFNFDSIQCPFNPLDHRLLSSGNLFRLKSEGMKVYVRSVFLQGLLLMPKEDRPLYFRQWDEVWGKWEGYLSEYSLSALQCCLNDVFSLSEIDGIVVGVDSLDQLKSIFRAISTKYTAPKFEINTPSNELLHPYNWR